MGAHLVSFIFVVNLKSSIRFELDFKMADLQATECGRCLLLIGQSATGDSIGSLCFLPCVLIIPSGLPPFFYPKYTPSSRLVSYNSDELAYENNLCQWCYGVWNAILLF